jgi:hypothetical protein
MIKNITILLLLITRPMYSQIDIDYKARSASYELCKCVNKKYQLEEEVIDLIISWSELDKYKFSRLLSKKPKELQNKVIKILPEIEKETLNNCTKILDSYYGDAINIVDSGDLRLVYYESIVRYTSYNYNCKLSGLFLKRMNEK